MRPQLHAHWLALVAARLELPRDHREIRLGGGADVVYMSGNGHGDPAVTLHVYSHLWAKREHGDTFRGLLDATLSAAVSTSG